MGNDKDRSYLDTLGDDEKLAAELKRSNDLLEESMALQRTKAVVSHRGTPDGSYSLGSKFSYGSSDVRDMQKALAAPDVLDRNSRELNETLGYEGKQLEAWTLATSFFKTGALAQLPRDHRHASAQRKMDELMGIIAKSDMSEGVNTGGGYGVPSIVGNEVLRFVKDASQVYGVSRKLPMTSNVLQFPDENTAVSINWVAEAGTLTQGEPVFGVKTLTAKKLAGRAVFSIELLDDANIAIVPFLQSVFTERFGSELDFQALEGPGTVFTGVQAAVSVGDCARTNGTNGVVLSYSSSTATIASLVQIFTKAGEQTTRTGGQWFCGPGVYAKIIGMVDNNNQPVARLGAVESAPAGTLFGRPIVVSNSACRPYTVGAGTVSVGSLYFGPPASALMFGVNTAFRWDVTDQVHWGNFQVDSRLVGRWGFVVSVPQAFSKQTGIII